MVIQPVMLIPQFYATFSVPGSQHHTSHPSPEPWTKSTHSHPVPSRSISTLFSHLLRGLLSAFSFKFTTKNFVGILFLFHTYPTLLILSSLTWQLYIRQGVQLWIFWLCNSLPPRFVSNLLLSTLFSNTLSLCSHISHSNNNTGRVTV